MLVIKWRPTQINKSARQSTTHILYTAINALLVELIQGNMDMYLHFTPSLHTEIVLVVELFSVSP